MLQNSQGQGGGQDWNRQAYMMDQLANQRGGYGDYGGQQGQDYGRRGAFEQQNMGRHRYPQQFDPGHYPPELMSTTSSKKKGSKISKKSKAASSRGSVIHENRELLNMERIYQIRGITDELGLMEKELCYTFKNFRKVTPFYKLKVPLKGVEIVSTTNSRPKTPTSVSISSQPTESKKSNKYLQNYFKKYEPEDAQAEPIDEDPLRMQPEREFSSTMPKATKPPQINPAKPQAKRSVKDLYKGLLSSNDALSFDGQDRHKDQFNPIPGDQDTIGFDSNVHSLRASQVSRTSSGSKRRESFDNFRRQYFADTNLKQNVVPPSSVAKKFTR